MLPNIQEQYDSLKRKLEALLQHLDSLSGEELSFKAGPDKWSVVEVELDKFSSFVFLQINGVRNIYEIGQILKNEYVEEIEQLYERLIIFLEFLNKQKKLTFQ